MPRGRPRTAVPPCSHCQKRFKRIEHLRRHERTHTNERPFVCRCGKGFTRRDLLVRHEGLMHRAVAVVEGIHQSTTSGEGRQISTSTTDEPPETTAVCTSTSTQGTAQIPTPMTDQPGYDVAQPSLPWNSDFMAHEILPSFLLDFDLAGLEPLSFVGHDDVVERAPDTESSLVPVVKRGLGRFSSRLPTLEDVEDNVEASEETWARQRGDRMATGTNAKPWDLSDADYNAFKAETQAFSAVLPAGCSVPTQTALIRCLEKYLRCVQEYIPFIHCATFQAGRKPPELVLAMAALGSRYLFEQQQSYQLYYLAKTILYEKIRREGLQVASDFIFGEVVFTINKSMGLERLQTLILLIDFASWADKAVSRDALLMAKQAAILAKEIEMSEPDEETHDEDWLAWVSAEEQRRTIFAAYTFSCMHSVAFGIPPVILNHEIQLYLPCYAAQWRAASASQWQGVVRPQRQSFQDGLMRLFGSDRPLDDTHLSSLANYLLLQGIIQEMYKEGYRSFTVSSSDKIRYFEEALRRWQSCWETTQESSHDCNLDPLYAKGPLALTGAALLRLAHIRLSSGQKLSRELLSSRNPESVLRDQAPLHRSKQVNRAVIHAAHSVSIPVRLGIPSMIAQKTAIWSIEHSICSLESACLLKSWLEMIRNLVMSSGPEALDKVEKRLLDIVTEIIKDTCLADSLDGFEHYTTHVQHMTHTVLTIHASIFQGVNVLPIENAIGAGLQLLASHSMPGL